MKRLSTWIVVTLLAVLVLAESARSERESVLTQRLWGNAVVMCAESVEQWQAQLLEVGIVHTLSGYVLRTDRKTIHLSPWVCKSTEEGSTNAEYGGHYLTLLHEYFHTQGIENEGEADCWALTFLRYWLRTQFKMKKAEVQAMYRVAWAYHMAKPRLYRGTCSYTKESVV